MIKTTLSCYIKDNHRKWDVFLPSVSCAIRTLVHEVTFYTPFLVNFGREHIINGVQYEDQNVDRSSLKVTRDFGNLHRSAGFRKLFESIEVKLAKAHESTSSGYNLRHRHVEYKAGDTVCHKNHSLSNKSKFFAAKLSPKYVGPFKIKAKAGRCSYELYHQ